ncbi:hypothetical protein EC968_006380 [Mortierella alpina]|nr:hypothetical protein EC968_006380 [Mortierella alpina]
MAFNGQGHRLGNADTLPLFDDSVELSSKAASAIARTVPSLKDICLSTLDRYIDLLEDIGDTPYYLIESVLKKCNVKQLTRIELHTEGLSESTDELWYRHATNDFLDFRKQSPTYDHSGEWRSKYETMRQRKEEELEQKIARLRQSYSQHDKVKQGRSVIVDPNLRLPKRTARSLSSTSFWPTAAPKKKSLFEKARMEARKITQMYASNPYPPVRNRTLPAANNQQHYTRTVERREAVTLTAKVGTGAGPTSRHIIAPTSVFAKPSTQSALGSMSSRNDSALNAPGTVVNGIGAIFAPSASTALSRTKRYTYKTRPVVYTAAPRQPSAQTSGASSFPSQTRLPSAPKLVTPSAPGAIVDFFREINPIQSLHATASYTGREDPIDRSHSPTSASQPPSRTIRMLREHTHDGALPERSRAKSSRTLLHGHPNAAPLKKVKLDGDYSWLEGDDDESYHEDLDRAHADVTKSLSKEKRPKKAPLSLEEAGRQFFNQVQPNLSWF